MSTRSEYRARYNAEHREEYAAYRRSRREHTTARTQRVLAHHRDRLAEARADGCLVCGSFEDLHFHHLDPSTKRREVATMTNYSDAAFAAEVAKCALLCGSCHRDHHRVLRAMGK